MLPQCTRRCRYPRQTSLVDERVVGPSCLPAALERTLVPNEMQRLFGEVISPEGKGMSRDEATLNVAKEVTKAFGYDLEVNLLQQVRLHYVCPVYLRWRNTSIGHSLHVNFACSLCLHMDNCIIEAKHGETGAFSHRYTCWIRHAVAVVRCVVFILAGRAVVLQLTPIQYCPNNRRPFNNTRTIDTHPLTIVRFPPRAHTRWNPHRPLLHNAQSSEESSPSSDSMGAHVLPLQDKDYHVKANDLPAWGDFEVFK